LSLGWAWLPSERRAAMAVKDAIIIMISFGTFIIALLSYIANNYKRK
jgi:hypothetical protein